MEQTMDRSAVSGADATTAAGYQAYQILRFGFTVAPILAGLDKFLHLMTDWDKYLPAIVNNTLGGRGHEFMMVVGVIEIVAVSGCFLSQRSLLMSLRFGSF